jgi:hypothetical protein
LIISYQSKRGTIELTATCEVEESGTVVQRFFAPRNAVTELLFGDTKKSKPGNRRKKVRFVEPPEVWT